MGLFRRGPSKLERLLAAARLDEALEQVQPTEPAEPPAAFTGLACTRTGRVAHQLRGGRAVCPEMEEWTDWDLSDEGIARAALLPLHSGCRRTQWTDPSAGKAAS